MTGTQSLREELVYGIGILHVGFIKLAGGQYRRKNATNKEASTGLKLSKGSRERKNGGSILGDYIGAAVETHPSIQYKPPATKAGSRLYFYHTTNVATSAATLGTNILRLLLLQGPSILKDANNNLEVELLNSNFA